MGGKLTTLSLDMFSREGGLLTDDVDVDLGGRDQAIVPYAEQVDLAVRGALSKIWIAPFAPFHKADLARVAVGTGPEVDVRDVVQTVVAQQHAEREAAIANRSPVAAMA